MINLTTRLFPLWAILVSVFAFYFPEGLAGLRGWIVPLLMLIMFGMGMTLTWQDFGRVLQRPYVVGIGVLLQYLIMPAVAFGVGHLLQLPLELLIGLVIVGSCPGGTASNVICYLARADVALSVVLTLVSTLLAVVATPVLTWLYIGQSVPVPVTQMLVSVMQIVLLPVLAGVLLNSLFGRFLRSIEAVFPLFSVAAIVLVIGIIVALNQQSIATAGALVLAAVVLHNGLGLALGYGAARLLRLPPATARTLAIEVGMQNSGLGVALAVKYFSPLAALPGAIFSIWHNLSGALLAWYWRRRSEVEESKAAARTTVGSVP